MSTTAPGHAAPGEVVQTSAAPVQGSTTSDDVVNVPPAKPVSLSGSLSASALIPQDGYARKTPGFGMNGGMWLQTGHLVVEPRASFRIDVADEKRDYVHLVPLEVSTYWFGRFDDAAVFLGPGANFQYVLEEVDLKSSVGSEIIATTERRAREMQYCLGVVARVLPNRVDAVFAGALAPRS